MYLNDKEREKKLKRKRDITSNSKDILYFYVEILNSVNREYKDFLYFNVYFIYCRKIKKHPKQMKKNSYRLAILILAVDQRNAKGIKASLTFL